MPKNTFMGIKSTLPFILMLFALGFLTACDSTSTEGTTTETVGEKIDTAMQNIKEGAQNMADKVENAVRDNDDSDFVVEAMVDNNMDINMIQAGLDRGTDKELKGHAKMMMADHKKLGTEIKAYADKKGYKVPEGDDNKSKEKLDGLNKNTKGKEWDKAWVDAMVNGHEDDIRFYDRNSNDVEDPELKTMITNTLPALRSHRDMMKQLQDKLGK
jgi:putative membrane protein